jgi:hypothetical protein
VNLEIKTKWLEALRSGRYIQGQACLQKINDAGDPVHCCLGVLCDIVAPELWNREVESDIIPCNDESALLPFIVMLEADVDEKTANILADMNDAGRKTFAEIADYIEAFV